MFRSSVHPALAFPGAWEALLHVLQLLFQPGPGLLLPNCLPWPAYSLCNHQVRRIKKVREMSRSRSSSITAVTANGTAIRGALSRSSSKQNIAAIEAPKNLPQRVSNSVIGVKGSFLKDSGKLREVEENPMARLKLLLVRLLACVAVRELTSAVIDRFVPHPPHPQLLYYAHACHNERTSSEAPPSRCR